MGKPVSDIREIEIGRHTCGDKCLRSPIVHLEGVKLKNSRLSFRTAPSEDCVQKLTSEVVLILEDSLLRNDWLGESMSSDSEDL